MAEPQQDRELELYRNLLETPKEFKDGFGWSTIIGLIFCGLVMLPGSIYLGLMSGQGLGQAASWVTVILFNEVARRALKNLSKQNLVILLHAASVIMAANALFPGGPFAQLIFRAYLRTSEAIRDSNMMDYFPTWWVPPAESPAITERNLLHPDWWIPIGLLVFMVFVGLIKRYTLGYFFFRLTSDIENLPFPMAPIQAQGAMAMAEAEESGTEEDPGKVFFDRQQRHQVRKKSERWRLFSFGAVLGISFGFLQVGIPALTGAFFGNRFFLIPQPFVDTTTLSETVLPATPTGLAIDLGLVLIGMVIPFWAVMGTGFAILLTIVLNPILHELGVLTTWQPGMDTINTKFSNEIDFWLSVHIGAALGLLIVSLFQSFRDVRRKMKQLKRQQEEQHAEGRESAWATPTMGRGDYPLWMAIAAYVVVSLAIIVITYLLLASDASPVMSLPQNRGALYSVVGFMFVFTFVYNPLISYLNARLLGIAGQTVEVPYVKEAAFILSGARGIEVWMAPVPIENFGHQAQAFRVNELTGTSFWSLWKTDFLAIPILLILSFTFWAFIWSSNEIPSAGFPYAQTFWSLQSKRTALLWSSTHVVEGQEDLSFTNTEFAKAIHPEWITTGTVGTVVLFAVLNAFGLPVFFVYGMIKGFGQFPHMLIPEVIGALIGRYYFQKKFGSQNFLRMVPTILAGYFTGVGLIGMATVATELIQKAISAAPF